MTGPEMSDDDVEHMRAHVIAQGLILDALIDQLVETRLVPAPALAMRLGRKAAEQADLLPEVSTILRQRRRELMVGAACVPWGRSKSGSGSADRR